MKVLKAALLGFALLTAGNAAQAQNEQFQPVLSNRVGFDGPTASIIFRGAP